MLTCTRQQVITSRRNDVKSLTKIRMNRIFQRGRVPRARETHALLWAESSADTARALMEAWQQGVVTPVSDLMVSLANTADDEIRDFQKLLPMKYDIARESAAD